MKRIALLFMLVILAETMSAQEQYSFFGSATSFVVAADLEIDRGPRTSVRSIEVYYDQQAESTKILSQVIRPSYLNNLKYLSIQDGQGHTSTWARTSAGVRLLPSGDAQREPLFNSDFFSGDFFISTMESSGQSIDIPWAVDGIPANQQFTEYVEHDREYIVWEEASLILGIRFVHGQRTTRELRVLEVHNLDGQYFPALASVSGDQEGDGSRFVLDQVVFVDRLPERLFSPNGL